MADTGPLKAAGMPIDNLSEEQREALNSLDQSEIDALASIRRKLDSNTPEVSGLARAAADDTGYVVW